MKFLLALLILSTNAFALDVPQITVQGNCDMKVTPDRGTITFTAENQSKDQKEAVKKTNEQINKLKEEIKALNLKELELKNTNYSVNPIREYEKDRLVDKGIRAALTLEVVTSEISRLGETMLLASKLGFKNVGSLQTFLSTEKSQEEYLKCLDIAADDARAKARQLGKKLGFQVGDVIGLNENPSISRPVFAERAMMKTMMDASAPTQVESGTQNFATNIQVTFRVK